MFLARPALHAIPWSFVLQNTTWWLISRQWRSWDPFSFLIKMAQHVAPLGKYFWWCKSGTIPRETWSLLRVILSEYSLSPLIIRIWVLLGLFFIRTGKGWWKSESYKISKNFNQMCLNLCYKLSYIEFTESFNWSVHAYGWASRYQGSPHHVKSRWDWHSPQFVKTNFSMPSIYTYSQKTCLITSFNAGHFTVLHVLSTFHTEWSLRGNLFSSFDFHKRPPRQDLVVTARFYQRRKSFQHNKQASWNRILNIPLIKNFLSNSNFNILAALNFPVFFSPFFHLVNNPSFCTIALGVVVLCRIFQLILWFVVSFLVLLSLCIKKSKTKQLNIPLSYFFKWRKFSLWKVPLVKIL